VLQVAQKRIINIYEPHLYTPDAIPLAKPTTSKHKMEITIHNILKQ